MSSLTQQIVVTVMNLKLTVILVVINLQGVSVEAVDPVFQAKMLDMLKQTGRSVFLSLLLLMQYDVSALQHSGVV